MNETFAIAFLIIVPYLFGISDLFCTFAPSAIATGTPFTIVI